MPVDKRMSHIIAEVGAEAKIHRQTNSTRRIGIGFAPRLFMLVFRAAKARDISLSAYAKRAAVSFACYDLGLNYYDEMQGDWPSTRFGSRGVDMLVEDYRDGKGAGSWRIRKLS